jgi:hypothetical protein
LDGVIHLAQVNRERALTSETRAGMTDILRPKIIGAWTLNQVLDGHGLFISFSSVNSFFGGYNYAAYAAANSFLEVFAQHQRRDGAIQSHCLAWSAWDDIGMSRGSRTKELAWQRGFHAIPSEQGVRSFLAAHRPGWKQRKHSSEHHGRAGHASEIVCVFHRASGRAAARCPGRRIRGSHTLRITAPARNAGDRRG